MKLLVKLKLLSSIGFRISSRHRARFVRNDGFFPVIGQPLNPPFHLFREPGQKRNGEKPDTDIGDETKKSASGPEKYIICRHCTQLITTSNERISVDGSHQHTFANPHGMIFDIGCFRSVIGCGYAGPPSDEFVWFKGFRWKVAVCGMCLTHLGWLFMSGSGNNFHGLILNRIAETSNQ